jgi:hypothetical protein
MVKLEISIDERIIPTARVGVGFGAASRGAADSDVVTRGLWVDEAAGSRRAGATLRPATDSCHARRADP